MPYKQDSTPTQLLSKSKPFLLSFSSNNYVAFILAVQSQKNKKGLMPHMMRITLDSQRIDFPTQLTLEESNWKKDNQEIEGCGELCNKYNQY